MPDYAESINTHYGQANLSAKILAALQETGKDINALTPEDLTSFDEHHGGGREAARELAGLAGVGEGIHVFDIGSDIGGPARTLAAEFGCRVTGLDLTEEFCHAAAMLTERFGLQHQITFEHGSALEMPFDDATFDVVWTQDVLMNIEDKGRLFTEAHRVLRPGGPFAFQANMTG